MITIPDYIEQRLRRPMPREQTVVAHSTPVPAFGDVRTATVATLGLNPSRREFQDARGRELVGSARRFETLTSLGLASLADASHEDIERVFQASTDYFHHHPYWTWFRQLETVLTAMGCSYRDGSACHLDVVQWATDPVWGKIQSASTREQLLSADAPFLRQQLDAEQIQVVLLNGRSVIDAFQQIYPCHLQWQPEPIAHGTVKTWLVRAQGPRGMLVVGWTMNIQSSRGVTNTLRAMLAQAVAAVWHR